jgi:hypothetical protein
MHPRRRCIESTSFNSSALHLGSFHDLIPTHIHTSTIETDQARLISASAFFRLDISWEKGQVLGAARSSLLLQPAFLFGLFFVSVMSCLGRRGNNSMRTHAIMVVSITFTLLFTFGIGAGRHGVPFSF